MDVVVNHFYRDENGEGKKQLKIFDEAAREAKPTERGRVWEGDSPSHDRSLSNLALKMVHSGGFENVNLLEGHGCKATLSVT